MEGHDYINVFLRLTLSLMGLSKQLCPRPSIAASVD